MHLLTRRSKRAPRRGQALVEFGLVLPLLLLIIFGIIQFGLLFWTQITLTQIARDAGRWAATQAGCADGTGADQADVTGEAKRIADESWLFAYGGPTDPNLTVTATWDPSPPPDPCPPADNQSVVWVRIGMNHTVPTFLPLLADTCSPSCQRTLTTSVQFRMEPEPAP
jgi:hypothetical protein